MDNELMVTPKEQAAHAIGRAALRRWSEAHMAVLSALGAAEAAARAFDAFEPGAGKHWRANEARLRAAAEAIDLFRSI